MCLLLLPVVASTATANPTAHLQANVDPAQVSVPLVEAGRNRLQLPALEFRFLIDAQCAEDDRAASISISIADTRKTLVGDDIATTTGLNVNITIPASQVAPLVVDDFCSLTSGSLTTLLVEDALTAHLSLRCAGDDRESITYATRPLAVSLTCAEEGQADSDPLILR